MALARQDEEGAIYELDPLHMDELQGYMLGLFLQQTYLQKGSEFIAAGDTKHVFPKVDPGTLRRLFPISADAMLIAGKIKYQSLRIKCKELKLRPKKYPISLKDYQSDVCYDVVGDGYYLNGVLGHLPNLLGTLNFDSSNGGVRFSPEVVFRFDPVLMERNENMIAGAFLQHDFQTNAQKEKLFSAYTQYEFVNKEVAELKTKPKFTLNRSLVRRLHAKAPADSNYAIYPVDYCYDIAEEDYPIGEGAYSRIYSSDYVLQPLTDHSLVCKNNENRNKMRLFKRIGMHDKKPVPKDEINNEYFITDLMLGSHVKHPIFFTSASRECIMQMRYVKGVNLQRLLETNNFTIQQSLEIFIACLMAIRRVHNKGIVHRDIKAENFIVDMTAKPIYATVIDYGLSMKVDTNNKTRAGTPFYAPPEYFEGIFDKNNNPLRPRDMPLLSQPFTQKADVYSASWIGNNIFRGDDNPSITLLEARDFSRNCSFRASFQWSGYNKRKWFECGRSISNYNMLANDVTVRSECTARSRSYTGTNGNNIAAT